MATREQRRAAIDRACRIVRNPNASPFVRRATKEDKIMPHVPQEHDIEAFSGRYIDVLNPTPEMICVEDIAHHLSQVNRFGGASRYPYSVAEHAVFVCRRMIDLGEPRGMAYAGLHHDDAEAYLGDIPRPLKPLLGDAYRQLTARMDIAIRLALRGPNEEIHPWIMQADFHCDAVKAADNFALLVEARHLLPSGGKHWRVAADAWNVDLGLVDEAASDPDYWTGGLSPTEAEGMFLSMHNELIVKYAAKKLPGVVETLKRPQDRAGAEGKHAVVYA